MATPLSLSEHAAQEMLLLHSKAPTAALETINAVANALAELYENNPDATAEEVNAAKETAIQNLGYATDLDSVSAQYAYLKDQHAGFWGGRYTIVDSNNDVHTLLIDDDNIVFLLNGTDEMLRVPSEGGGFSGQKLVASNDKVDVAFTFATSTEGVDLLTLTPEELNDLADGFHLQVTGNFTIKGTPPSQRNIIGVRGVSTAAGVFHAKGEEPGWIWAGQYRLSYTDTPLWTPVDDLMIVGYDDATASLSVQWGALTGTKVACIGNTLAFQLEMTKGVLTQATLQMLATSGGLRKCFVWLETTGQMRTLTGNATDILDKTSLQRGAKAVPGPKLAMANVSSRAASRPGPLAVVTAGSTPDFCETVYDAIFTANNLVSAESTDKSAADLINLQTITAVTGTGTNATRTDVSGYRVDETGHDGAATGRIAMFVYDATKSSTDLKFPKGSKVKAYAPLDEALEPETALTDMRIGLLSPTTFELPALVETDYYEVRMSLQDPGKISTSNLDIGLAIDDANQKKLVRLYPPSETKICPVSTDGSYGPDVTAPEKIADYTKASVLVRGATGETQNVGDHDYYFSVAPTGSAGICKVSRRIYAPTATAGEYTLVESDDNAEVPILMHILLHMDSRDAIEIVGDAWAPAARGKSYKGSIVASKGQQPFTWRLTKNDKPGDLAWTPALTEGTDVSTKGLSTITLAGTVGATEDPGTTYQPIIRVMSDKSCVMKPVVAMPQLTIVEPEIEQKQSVDVANVISAVLSASVTLAAFIFGAVTYVKSSKLDKETAARERRYAQAAANLIQNVDTKFTDLGTSLTTATASWNDPNQHTQQQRTDAGLRIEAANAAKFRIGLQIESLRLAITQGLDTPDVAKDLASLHQREEHLKQLVESAHLDTIKVNEIKNLGKSE